MNMNLGPYEKYVREKLAGDAVDPLSESDIMKLRSHVDYVAHSSEFISVIMKYEDKVLNSAPSCVLILSALLTIDTVRGNHKAYFENVWQRISGLLCNDSNMPSSSFDLDTAFNAIRLGVEAGTDVSTVLEVTAKYLTLAAGSSYTENSVREILSITSNHYDVLSSIYKDPEHQQVSLEIDGALEKLKELLEE